MPGLLLRRSTSVTRSNINTFSAPSPSPSPPPTLHHRRILLRSNTSSPPPPALQGLGLPSSLFPNESTPALALLSAKESESDVECWLRMLALQREYHCYNSARLEAAVEALERGWSIEEVPIRTFLALPFQVEQMN
jgi:hypothetical protein